MTIWTHIIHTIEVVGLVLTCTVAIVIIGVGVLLWLQTDVPDDKEYPQ